MRVIDLSARLHTGMEVFKGDPEVKFDVVHTHENETWELRNLSLGSHTGTHVDAFSHMHRDMETLDEIPIERFFGKSKVVNICSDLPKRIGLFFTQEIGIEHLTKIINSNPRFIGGNMSENLERALLGRGIITYTGLVNLDLIPKGKSFMFYGLPLRIASGDGSPVRAIAIIDD